MSKLVAPGALLCLLLFVSFEPTRAAKECTIGESLIASALCSPIVIQLKFLTNEHKGQLPSVEVYQNVTQLCGAAIKCFKLVDCSKANEARKDLEKVCGQLDILAGDVTTCVPKFFSAVYNKKYECVTQNDYFSSDLEKRRHAYTAGKPCVLEVAEKECSNTTHDWLDTKYEKLVDVLTVKPNGTDCRHLHHTFESLQCAPMIEAFGRLTASIDSKTVMPDDPRLDEVSQFCKKSLECMNKPCLLSFQEKQKDFLKGCRFFGIVKTKYFGCARKIKSERPDLSKYACLEGHDFFDTTTKAVCEKFTKFKECSKTVYEGECGKEAVEDFDNNVDLITGFAECK